MSSERPSAEEEARPSWGRASARGFLVLLLLAVLGQALAVALRAAGLGPRSPGNVFKVGFLYVSWFHHAVVRVSIQTPPEGGGALGGGVHAGLAFLSVTGLAAFLLFRAGRSLASGAGGGAMARTLHGAEVAPAYAIGALLASLPGTMRFETAAFGVVTVRPDRVQAFLLPLILAAVAGGAGGLLSDAPARDGGRRLAAVLVGGFRMLVLALTLSFVALLLLAAMEPESTREYFNAVSEPSGARTALILGHHILLLPNQSMWVLVPAMGGCDEVRTPNVTTRLACFERAPRVAGTLADVGVTKRTLGAGGGGGGRPSFRYLIFLLVPPLSTFLGGRVGARASARSSAEGAAIGAAAGVVFALLVVVGSWASGATGTLVGGSDQPAGRFSVGPSPLIGGSLALAWGVVLGATGGWFEVRRPLSGGAKEQQAQQV